MTDQDYTHESLTVHGRFVPESDPDFDPSAYDTDDPVTGTYEIGVEIDGVFVPIFTEKASKIATIVERKQAAAADAEASGEPAQVSQGSSEREQDLLRQLDEYRQRDAEREQQQSGQ